MILVVDMGLCKLAAKEFVAPIERLLKGKITEVVHYSKVSANDLRRCNAVILSGTPLKDMEFTRNPEAFGWLKNFEKPVLGICAGMQTICMAFGSEIERCQEIGMVRIETLKDNPLFSGKFNAYALHNFAVQTPAGFDIIASSERCVHGIRHKSRNIYGVMFHPEVRNGQIIENFVKNVVHCHRL